MVRRDNELHVGVKKRPAGAYRKLIRDVLQDTIKRHGCALTAVRTFNTSGMKFCQRLGFEVVGTQEEIIYLRCRRAHHV